MEDEKFVFDLRNVIRARLRRVVFEYAQHTRNMFAVPPEIAYGSTNAALHGIMNILMAMRRRSCLQLRVELNDYWNKMKDSHHPKGN